MAISESKEVRLKHKRWLTFICAFILFIFVGVLVCSLILLFVLPTEYEADGSVQVRIFAVVFVAIFGGMLLLECFFHFINLRHKYAVVADENGIHWYCAIATTLSIPWDEIISIRYANECTLSRYNSTVIKSLFIILKSGTPYIKKLNLFYKIQARLHCIKYRDGSISCVSNGLYIDLFTCEGKPQHNAQKIINLWERYYKVR